MSEEPPTLPAGRFYRLAWGFYLVLALAGGLWIGARLGGPVPLALFFDPAAWWLDLALGAAGGLALLGLWAAARRALPLARDLEDQLAALLGALDPGEAVALALLSGFAEELFFRGAVQGAWGWLPATLLFALLHSGPGRAFRLWTLFAAAAGLLFAGFVAWRGNLAPAIVAHAVVNGVNLLSLARRAAKRAASRAGDSGRLAATVEKAAEREKEND